MASKYGYMATIGADTSGLTSALQTVDSEAKKITSELREINNNLKFEDGGTVALQQKYDLLQQAIEQTTQKLEMLRSAEADVNAAAAAGTISEANQRSFQRELDSTANRLARYQGELEGVRAVLDGMENSADSAADHIENATNEVENLGNAIEGAGQQTVTFGDILKANILSDLISAGINKIKNSVMDFAQQGIELASDLTEVQNVVDVTFGDGAQQIYDWADAAAESFGMSSLAAQEYNGTMGAMLKSMGLADDKVKEMSMDMVGLAGDMASFYNLPVEQAFQKIRSGISGETEPLKQLGINMSVANLEAYALSQGIETAYKKMTEAEKATLRYNYLMAQTADAQGDFARTSDSFANQQKILELQTQNLAASFGEKLLPNLNNVLQTANDKLPKLENTAENIGEVLGKVTEFAIENHEAILSLITAYGTFYGVMKAGNVINTAVTAVKTLTTATQAATAAQKANNAAAAANPYVLLASAIAAVTVGLITYANSIDSVHNRIKDVNKEVKELKKNTEESISSTEAEIAVFKDKARQYEELLEIEKRTAGEEEQLKKLAEELQQYMPEGTQLINEQTGAYNSLADSVDSVAAAMRRRAIVAAYEEEYTGLIKQQIEAERALEKAKEKAGSVDLVVEDMKNKDGGNKVKKAEKEVDEAQAALDNIENRKKELEIEMENYLKQEPKQQISTSETYAEYMKRKGEQQEADRKQRLADELADYEENLKAKKEELDNSLALRRISEEEYYQEIGNYLSENKNLSSKEYFELLGKYENYLDKKQKAADKAAEDEQKAEKERQKAAQKASEDLETERINAIKASWDKVTRMRERGEIDEAAEYKAKAQIVKKYCDENEATWDSYYKWLYDYSSKKEKEITDAKIKAWEDNSKKLSDTIAESYKELKAQKEQVKKELQSIDLTETVKDNDGNEVTVLKDLDAEIKKIDKLKVSREKLKATGISDSLMAEIDKMSYADGSRQRYIDQLLSLSPENLQLYYGDWEKWQAKQEEFAQDTIQDGLDKTNQAAAEGVKDIFGNIPKEAYEDGIETARQYLRGILDGMGDLDATAALRLSGIAERTVVQKNPKNPEASNVEKLLASGALIPASTPININLNDKAYISRTIADLINMGKITGGNPFNL